MAKKERTPEDMLRQFIPGSTLEPLLNLLAMARDGGDEFDPEQEVELIKIGKTLQAAGAAMESAPKDRWYDVYIGILDCKTQFLRGCKVTVVDPSEPKTTTEPAHYKLKADAVFEICPPHEYPDLYTLIPSSTTTTAPKKRGQVAVEILDEAYAVADAPAKHGNTFQPTRTKAKAKRKTIAAADVPPVAQAEIDDLFHGGGDTAHREVAV